MEGWPVGNDVGTLGVGKLGFPVGAGMVGLCVARLLVGYPGVVVTVVDTDPARAEAAHALEKRVA